MLAEIETRLEAQVPQLHRRVEDAASFAQLMAKKSFPGAPLVAYVLHLGYQASAATAAAGAFIQPIRETVAVLLIVNSADQTGAKALAELEPLIRDIMLAIAGWAPGDTVGVFELVRGNLIDPGGSRLAYQLEFAVNDQLRITS